MSDIGKYLFEVTAYGSIFTRGKVIAETDKTWTAQEGEWRPRRVIKSGNIIPSTNPDAKALGAAAYAIYREECDRLEAEARNARKAQREAVIAAIRGDD